MQSPLLTFFLHCSWQNDFLCLTVLIWKMYVIYCCVTINHKFKRHPFISSQFWRSEVCTAWLGSLLRKNSRSKSRCQLDEVLIWRLWEKKINFYAHACRWQNSVSHMSLKERLHSEKCFLRWFCHCVGTMECTFTALDGVAHYTPRLQPVQRGRCTEYCGQR